MISTKLQTLWLVIVTSMFLNTIASAQVRCDQFDVVVKLNGHTLTLSLETDLPDETTLMVSVDRLYWQNGSEDAYFGSYISGRFTVGEWRQPRHVEVNDDVWHREVKDRKRLMALLGEPFKVRKIAEEIEADFTVPVNQKDPRFGRRNEKLSGSKVITSSSGLRIIEATKQIHLPLGSAADTANKRMPVHAYNLEKGKKYRLTSRVPLMPRREGKDVQDLGQVRQLDDGDVIEVLEKDESGTNPWYHVNADGKSGQRIGSGWINSKALLRQELWESEDAKNKTHDSYIMLGEVRDVSYANVKRLSIRIELPLSRTHEQVKATIRKAALDLYKKEGRRPKAINVFAYMPGDDHEMAYTVGKADYAPNGKWEDASKRAPMKFSIEIGTVYFEVSKLYERFGPGTKIRLRSSSGDLIQLSQSTDDWSEHQIVAHIPPKTSAEIVDRKVWAITSTSFMIWYRVKVQYNGQEITGWVRRKNVYGSY
ncbi:MAG: hypothetical protein O7G85_06330 [Planctomycetota bacterium]|nr:hypothetical protein [Planctomycetota bacterium]